MTPGESHNEWYQYIAKISMSLRIFILFPYKKVLIKKIVCLPTDPKIFGHVTGNKAYFSFGLTNLLQVKLLECVILQL